MKTSACSSCGATILFALTKNLKRIPLDPQPLEERTAGQRGVFMLVRRLDDVPLAWPAAIETPDSFRELGVSLHVSHFSSCPSASQHRRSR